MSGNFEVINMNMRMGMAFTIKGRIHAGIDRFAINLGQGKDLLNIHFNPRFDQSTIVCNTFRGGNWEEEHVHKHLTFSAGSYVKFIIAFEDNQFRVTLPDGYVISFPNRLGHQQVHYLTAGGFSVSSFKLEGMCCSDEDL